MEHVFANLIVTRLANALGVTDLSLISICVGSFTGIFETLKEKIMKMQINNNNNDDAFVFIFLELFQDYIYSFMYICLFLFLLSSLYFFMQKETTILVATENTKNINSLSLLLSNEQQILVQYMKQCPFILEKHQQMKWGSINELEIDKHYSSSSLSSSSSIKNINGTLYNEFNISVKYKDQNFNNIDVEIIWLKNEEKKTVNEKECKIITSYPKITLANDNNYFTHAYCYFDAIKTFLENQSKDKIKIITSKIFPDQSEIRQGYSFSSRNKMSINTELYFGKELSLQTKNELFLHSYFKHEKHLLFSHLYQIENNPMNFIKFGQIPKYGALLYGPTGSGKSSLIYRLARYLNRNIILIDIKEIFQKKHLYELINDPYTGNKHGNIIVLEEIDISLEILYKEEYQMQQKTKLEKNNIIIDNYEENITITSSEKKPSSFLQTNNSSKYDYNLRDLLSILDGPSPENGRIIIATTNHYDKIYHFCPELYRHGRLTPIYIGYLILSELQELCFYYFQQHLNDQQIKQLEHQFDANGELKIKTSAITEHLLTKLANCEKKDVNLLFESFVTFLQNC